MAGYSKPNKFDIEGAEKGSVGNFTKEGITNDISKLAAQFSLTKEDLDKGTNTLKEDYTQYIQKLYNKAVEMLNNGKTLEELPKDILRGYQEYKKILEEQREQQGDTNSVQENTEEELGNDR